jgi:hypothetical protein
MNKFFTLLLLLVSVSLFAQNNAAKNGGVKGFVYDKSSGEPVPFATINIDSSDLGANTDDKGFFNIPSLAPGTYKIIASYLGFENQVITVEIKKGQANNIKFYMVAKSVDLKDVEINGERQKQLTESRVSVTSITPVEMKRMPTIGGEADIAQYLQLIPGVVSTGDQGGQIIIRGATSAQTLFLLDGIPIYNPFHSIGLFSVFETDVIKNVDVYTGGFPAQYGSRTGAVVDVSTRDGNMKDFSGDVGVTPFTAHALLEIPIIKLKEEGGTDASLILSTKDSYLDQSSKIFYPYASNGSLPYSFYDAYGKFTLNTGTGNKFSVTGFNFKDNADFSGADYHWDNYGVGANFLAVPRNANIYFNTHVSYTKYDISFDENNQPRSSGIGAIDIGMDFTNYINNGELRYGLNIESNSTSFDFVNDFQQDFSFNQSSTDLSAYLMYHKYYKKFVIDIGARFQYYGVITAASPEPRLNMKYNVTDRLRFKMASGLYSQTLMSTKNNQDVVDLFTGFLDAPNESAQDANGVLHTAIHNMQRSVDAIFGVEVDLPKNITLNIEPYYKYFWHLFDLNIYKTADDQSDFMLEKGASYGLDILMKWQYKGLFLYGTYSLAYNQINDFQQIYAPYYDRRHNVNLVAAYDFGRKRSWEVSARWNYGSGFPFTQTQAFYENNPFTAGISTNYTGTNGNLGILYAQQIDGGRLPAYSRLDLEIKKIWSFGKKLKLEANASVANVYDRQNIFYFNPVTYARVNQLPILPSLAVAFSF